MTTSSHNPVPRALMAKASRESPPRQPLIADFGEICPPKNGLVNATRAHPASPGRDTKGIVLGEGDRGRWGIYVRGGNGGVGDFDLSPGLVLFRRGLRLAS